MTTHAEETIHILEWYIKTTPTINQTIYAGIHSDGNAHEKH